MQSKSHLYRSKSLYQHHIMCIYYMYITCILHVYYMYITFLYIYIIQIQNYALNQAGLKLHPNLVFFFLVQADADHDLPRVRLEQPPVDMSEASPTSPASVESRQDGRRFSCCFFGWGCFFWILRMVEVGFLGYLLYIVCVCVSSCSVLERIASLMMTMPASMSVNLLLEISDVPTPPMRRSPHHAVQWCLTAHVGGCNATWTRHGSPMETAVSMAGAPAMAAEGKTTLWPLELDDILKTARDLPMRTALFQQLRPG